MQKIKDPDHNVHDCHRPLPAAVCAGVYGNESWKSLLCVAGQIGSIYF